jgi:hypothetical protein
MIPPQLTVIGGPMEVYDEATTMLGSELELEKRTKTQNTSRRTADLLGN